MVCECDPETVRKYARYYDTPDGEDIATKALVTTRYGIVTGFLLSTYDALMYSHATRLPHIMQRYAMHCGHLGAMGATFAVVANGMQIARDQDDVWNYFAGGFACGPILASYLGSKHAVLLGGLALGVIGMIKKTGVEEGWEFFPNYPSHRNLVNSWRHDYTWAKDPKDELIKQCALHKDKKKEDDECI